MLKNKARSEASDRKNRTNFLIDEACSDIVKQKLAKVSEEENFALKNAFKHQHDTMNYADKRRMPIDSRKVRDMLRNQHFYRA